MKFKVRKVRKKSDFNPKSDFIKDEIEKFIKNGGKITKIIPTDYSSFPIIDSTMNEADDFLLGGC